jgi:hypothetical protein
MTINTEAQPLPSPQESPKEESFQGQDLDHNHTIERGQPYPVEFGSVPCTIEKRESGLFAYIHYTDLIKKITDCLETAGFNSKSKQFDSAISHWLDICQSELGIDGIILDVDQIDNGRPNWLDEIDKRQRIYDAMICELGGPSEQAGKRPHIELWCLGRSTWQGLPVADIPNYIHG